MATIFRYEYSKFKFLSENIATQNIKYFAAQSLDPVFILSPHTYPTEKRPPDIICFLHEIGCINISNDTLCEQIKDHIGLAKYRNNYFSYDTDYKKIIHIKNNYILLKYLFSLTISMHNYCRAVSSSDTEFTLYKIEEFKFENLK